MGKYILYGSCPIILIMGSWFYYHGKQVPENIMPLFVFLFAIMFFGYAQKAKEDGDVWAGSIKMYRDKQPKVFKFALYVFYFISVALLLWSGFLFAQV